MPSSLLQKGKCQRRPKSQNMVTVTEQKARAAQPSQHASQSYQSDQQRNQTLCTAADVEIGPLPRFHSPPDIPKRCKQAHHDDHEPLYRSGGGRESDVAQHSKADNKRTGDLAEPIGEVIHRGCSRRKASFRPSRVDQPHHKISSYPPCRWIVINSLPRGRNVISGSGITFVSGRRRN